MPVRKQRALLIHVDTGAVLPLGSAVVLEDPDGTGTVLRYKGISSRPSGPSGLGGRIEVSPDCSHARNNHRRDCMRVWYINPSRVGARIDLQ